MAFAGENAVKQISPTTTRPDVRSLHCQQSSVASNTQECVKRLPDLVMIQRHLINSIEGAKPGSSYCSSAVVITTMKNTSPTQLLPTVTSRQHGVVSMTQSDEVTIRSPALIGNSACSKKIAETRNTVAVKERCQVRLT